jgi:hypothetical protein
VTAMPDGATPSSAAANHHRLKRPRTLQSMMYTISSHTRVVRASIDRGAKANQDGRHLAVEPVPSRPADQVVHINHPAVR